jgi:hypothetical protein
MPWREAYIEIKRPCTKKILKNGSLRKENNGVSSLSDPTVEAKSWVFAPENRVEHSLGSAFHKQTVRNHRHYQVYVADLETF